MSPHKFKGYHFAQDLRNFNLSGILTIFLWMPLRERGDLTSSRKASAVEEDQHLIVWAASLRHCPPFDSLATLRCIDDPTFIVVRADQDVCHKARVSQWVEVESML